MSIRRAPRPESNFYLLDKSISEDDRLSWSARGMLIFLLGKPDHWIVSVANLINETSKAGKKTGRDGVYAVLKELESAGYLSREKARADGGEFGGVDYIVNESPLTDKPDTVKPDTVGPDTVGPDTANPRQVSTDGLVSNDASERIDNTPAPSSDAAVVFEHWRSVMGKSRRTVLDSNRKRIIQKALANYSLDDVKAAITGCSLSPHHMGRNDRNTVYNGLDLILRNAEKIEQFIGYSENPPANIHSLDQRRQAGQTFSSDADDCAGSVYIPRPACEVYQ